MMLPIGVGFLNVKRTPVTLCLVVLNVVMFLMTRPLMDWIDPRYEAYSGDDQFVKNAGVVAIHNEPIKRNLPSWFLKRLSIKDNTSEDYELAGRLFLHRIDWRPNWDEILRGESVPTDLRVVNGLDPITNQLWWQRFGEMRQLVAMHPGELFGLSRESFAGIQLLTYQFMHSDWEHLVGNLVFVWLFGGAIEVLFGPMLVLVLYLGAGVVAGLVYMVMNPESSLPLVGASGSLTGFFAALCATFGYRRLPQMFFFGLPGPFFAGIIYLPAAWILLGWFATDLAGYFNHLDGITSGVAHSAHLGGMLAGLMVAIVLRRTLAVTKTDALITPLKAQNLGALNFR